MKKNLSTILSAICCVLLVFSLIQINGLKEEVSSLRNRLTNEMQNVESRIHGISGEVRAALEEEANLLSASAWEYGGINVKNKSAEVLCSLVPKLYSPEMTRAFLLCNGEEIPMAYENGQYTARLELALFVDVVDGEGLRYRSFADGLAIGADGDVDERRADHMRMFRAAEPLWIFDENGEVLYEIAEEYFD